MALAGECGLEEERGPRSSQEGRNDLKERLLGMETTSDPREKKIEGLGRKSEQLAWLISDSEEYF